MGFNKGDLVDVRTFNQKHNRLAIVIESHTLGGFVRFIDDGTTACISDGRQPGSMLGFPNHGEHKIAGLGMLLCAQFEQLEVALKKRDK